MISIDTKKKELVGDFKAVGRELAPKGAPIPVRVYDFRDPILGKAITYGIYDLADDTGWVNVGIDHDTAQFAVASIRGWWEHLRRERYPKATSLTITADCGGSNAAPAPGCGRPSSSGSPTRPGFRSRSATSRPEPASGTASSIASSASSARTGAGSRSSAVR